MHVVAIDYRPGPGEALAGELAEVLGKSLYEARARLSDPAGGPAVAATYAEIDPARDRAARLRAGGFDTLLLSPEQVEVDSSRFLVRGFQLGERGLTVHSRQGQSTEIAYADVVLLLRGVRPILQAETKTVEERKFSPARAILSGGLIFTKTTRRTRQVTNEEREGFLHLYAAGKRPLALRENALDYQSLGPALRPSVAANFSHLLAELRRACPGALYDERLAGRAGRARVLGPSLNPERHLDIAISVLARVLRERLRGRS